jgi:hypothetical protein
MVSFEADEEDVDDFFSVDSVEKEGKNKTGRALGGNLTIYILTDTLHGKTIKFSFFLPRTLIMTRYWLIPS